VIYISGIIRNIEAEDEDAFQIQVREVVIPPSLPIEACKSEQDQFLSLLNTSTQIWLSCAPPRWETPKNFGFLYSDLQTLK